MKKRPIGLTIFAVVNFIFGGLGLLSFLVAVLSVASREQASLALSAYNVCSPFLTAALLLMLTLRYRRVFSNNEAAPGQSPVGDALPG